MRHKSFRHAKECEDDKDIVVPTELIEELGRQIGEFLAREENLAVCGEARWPTGKESTDVRNRL